MSVIHVEDYIANRINALLNIKFIRLNGGSLSRVPITVIIAITDDNYQKLVPEMKLDMLRELNTWSVLSIFKRTAKYIPDFVIALEIICQTV